MDIAAPVINFSTTGTPGEVTRYLEMYALDEIVVRTALIGARNSLALGLSIEEAARTACVGYWQSYRDYVEQALRDTGLDRSYLDRS